MRELPSAGGYVGIGEPGNRTTWAAVIDDIMWDDLTTKNVIVHEGRLSGFVDFDCVCYGDPLLQLGLTQTAVTSDGDERSRHYVEALFASAGLTPQDRRIVDLYPAVFGVEFLRDHPEVERVVGAPDRQDRRVALIDVLPLCYMAERVGVRDLRQNLSRWLRRVENGESFEVTDRGRPVAQLNPLPTGDGVVDRLARAGRIVKVGKGNLADLPPPRPRRDGEPSISDVLQELREDKI